MNTASIYKEMEIHAENDDWTTHAKAEARLLKTRTSRLKEIGPKIHYLAKLMGDRDKDDIEGRLIKSLLRDVGAPG